MRKLLIAALSLMIVLMFSFTTLTTFASEVFDIVEVEEAELEDVIEEAEEIEIYAAGEADSVCYIGEEYFADIDDAIYYTYAGRTHYGKTIKLLKNCILDGVGTNETRSNYYGFKFTIDGLASDGTTVYTLSVNTKMKINGGSSAANSRTDATFTNVTLDLSGIAPNYLDVEDFGRLTLGKGATVTGGKNANGQGGGVFLNSNSSVNGSPELIMESGSKITNCTALWAGGIRVGNKGILRLKGGTVENCTATTASKGDGIQVKSGGKVYLSGDAVVANNTGENILLADANQLVLDGSFSGNVVVNYTAGLGETFGIAESGAEITGDGVITNASTSTPGTISDGKLVWDYNCYIGTDEPANRRYNLDKVIVPNDRTNKNIYLVKDATWKMDSGSLYSGGIPNSYITVYGNGHKITTDGKIKEQLGCVWIFDNVTVDFNGKNFEIANTSEATLQNGAKFINGGGHVGGTVAIMDSAVFTVKSGCYLDGTTVANASSEANVGSVIHIHATGTLNFLGGEIANKGTTHPAISCWGETKGTIKVSGDAKITGDKNYIRCGNSSLVLTGTLTEDINVSCGSLGDTFGTAESGSTMLGSIINYSTNTPAVIKDGRLVWDYACYIGTDTAANRKYSLNEALRGTTAKTVYLVRDAEWVPHEDSNAKAIANLKAIVNGNGYTLTPSKQLLINVNVDLTFENVTVNFNGYKILFQSDSKLTLNEGAHFINGGSGSGQGGTLETPITNRDITITMNEGSSIKESKAEYGGAMVLNPGSKLIMNGGEISGNQATVGRFGGGVYTTPGSKVIISGNAKIEGNRSGPNWDTAMTDNLCLTSEDILTVNPGFTGHIGINYEANIAEGKAVAKAGSGLVSLPSVKSITNDRNAYHFGWIDSEGNIIWQLAPKMVTTLQYGTYAEGSKGIIRFTNKFAAAPANAKVTKFGTYILDNSSFSEADLAATDNKFVKTEQSVLASGKGFITDLHTGNLEKSYTASSFCYIEGIEAPVFTTISADAINSADGVIELSDEAVAGYESLYKN